MTSKLYTATRDLYVGPHVCAYREGDTVPASAVEANGWKDDVKAGASDPTPAPTSK